MNRILKILSFIAALLMLTGCNLPASQAPGSGLTTEQQAATSVAATLAAQSGGQPATNVAPFASPSAPTPASAAQPSLVISAATASCRRGPGASFGEAASFTAGTSLVIVARNTANNYWEVSRPNSTDTCWIAGQDATASGDLGAVPEAAVTPSAAVPAKPGSIQYSYTCTSNSISVSLTWADAADNEAGYHIYRSGTRIADLPPNSTSYQDTISSGPPQALQYGVAAYNDSGESDQRVVQFTACP